MIDVETRDSPGWWLERLSRKLVGRTERIRNLQARFEGDAPMPDVSDESARVAYKEFRRKARTNYAELIVEAVRERMMLSGFRTAADGGDDGDVDARRRYWEANRLDIEFPETVTNMLSLGDGYMIVGAESDERIGAPPITNEHPLQVVTEHDPMLQQFVVAAAKIFHDDLAGEDVAYLYLPDSVHVAVRAQKRANRAGVRFSAQSWDWDEDREGALDGMPVFRLRNRRGVGEFERHVDLLDRLDHQVYQRMVIATMQAFRQRAVKGLPFTDAQGKPLTIPGTDQPVTYEYYSDLFAADPGSFWALPETAEMWESGQVDLSPLSTIDRDDVIKLSAVTRTPLPMLMPGGDNESAEGAAFKKEGLVFKTEDRLARATEFVKDVMAHTFKVAGDKDRSDRGAIEVLWKSPERRSLSERASASAQIGDALPFRTKLRMVWDMSPTEIATVEAERAAESLLLGEDVPPDAA